MEKENIILLGKLIRELREAKDYSQRKLSLLSGVSNTTISRIEKGETENPDVETLKKIAPHLNTSTEDLLEKAGYIKPDFDKTPLNTINTKESDYVSLPVLNAIKSPSLLVDKKEIIDWEEIEKAELDPGYEHFFLKVHGDEMTDAGIVDGSIVLVRKQEQIKTGQIAVVIIPGENAIVKQLQYFDDRIALIPRNNRYSMKIESSDSVKIIGLVLEVRTKFI